MSEEKATKEQPRSAEIDKELSELLDTIMNNFPNKEGVKKDTSDTKEDVKKEGEETAAEEFMEEAAMHFESNTSGLLEDAESSPLSPEKIQQSIQRMAEAAQQVLENPGEISDLSADLSSIITQTLQCLREGTYNLENPFSEEDLMNMFSTEGEQNGFLPFMQGMMQSLLSKEVLYPSLKHILGKYPDWLQQNVSTLSAEDKQRYENQQKLTEDVCKELELENEADSAEDKRQQFEKVLSLTQKFQDYGQPPKELMGTIEPEVLFNSGETLNNTT